MELRNYGYTEGCPGCNAAKANKTPVPHNSECRDRIEAAIRATDESAKEKLDRISEARDKAAEHNQNPNVSPGPRVAPAKTKSTIVPLREGDTILGEGQSSSSASGSRGTATTATSTAASGGAAAASGSKGATGATAGYGDAQPAATALAVRPSKRY